MTRGLMVVGIGVAVLASWACNSSVRRVVDDERSGEGGEAGAGSGGANGTQGGEGGDIGSRTGTTGSGGSTTDSAGGSAPVSTGMGGVADGSGGMDSSSAGQPPGGATGTPNGEGGSGGEGEEEEDLDAVAAVLHGRTILMPCEQDTSLRVCRPVADPCVDPVFTGWCAHDDTVNVGGMPGRIYNVTLRVRGLVEAKTYQGGADRDNSGEQVPADGLYVGGQPNNTANAYDTYMIRVASPAQDYFLNSIGTGADSRLRHSVFEVDFTFDLPVEGGTSVRLVHVDPNDSGIKNCAEPDIGSECTPATLPNLDPAIADSLGSAQPYNGQFAGITVEGVSVAE
jgi:hypothetical protein